MFDLLVPQRRLTCSVNSTDGSTAQVPGYRQYRHSRRLLHLPRNIALPDSPPRTGPKLAMDLAYDAVCLPTGAVVHGFGNDATYSY